MTIIDRYIIRRFLANFTILLLLLLLIHLKKLRSKILPMDFWGF